ncbi:MAG: hypothetical protein HZC37_18335 [Burkholderiales bacterium]|nr:hypothetical protein [Burkholderiales bacterium]
MAYTLEEVYRELRDPRVRFNYAKCVYLVTQDDGRTSYSEALTSVQDLGLGTGLCATFSLVFNDRLNGSQRFSQDKADQVVARMAESSPNHMDATFRLDSWGGTILTVNLTRPRPLDDSKLYLGWGPAIGNAPGSALYCICFKEMGLLG